MNLFDVYPLFPIELEKGEGVWLWDSQNKKYLDFYGGHAVVSVGHSHPHYLKRITEQLQRLGFFSNSVEIPLQKEFAQKLGEMSGCEKYRLFLCNSGAEANENALKLASFHTEKNKVVAFIKAFHGRTSAAVEVTDNPSLKAPINQNSNAIHLVLNDLEMIENHLKTGEFAAVIVEGIQGIGGIHIPSCQFLRGVRELTRKYNALMILDEVQSGYGRTGKFFAYQHADIEPDIITIAKGMGNGFPIGGVLIASQFEAKWGLLGSTFGGNHLACAAGVAVLEIMEKEQLMRNATTLGDYLKGELRKRFSFKEVRGRGLMIGMESKEPIKEVRQKLLFEHSIFTGVSGENIIRLLPPLSITKEHADRFLDALEQSLG